MSPHSPSPFLVRVIDSSRYRDYFFIAIIGLLPIACAYVIGAHRTSDGYLGYWQAPNWMFLSLTLSFCLFIVRWSMDRIAAVAAEKLEQQPPSIVALIQHEGDRQCFYRALRNALLSRWVLLSALTITAVITILDLSSVAGIYIRSYFGSGFDSAGAGIEKDWSIFFTSTSGIGRAQNLVLVVLAYGVQFIAVFLAILLVIWSLVHNLFFLRHIYQRRRVVGGDSGMLIKIDLLDPDKCFGFRKAYRAFNTQVLWLIIAGSLLLLSRFVNVAAHKADTHSLFPDVGQWIIAITWICGLLVISLPGAVKLLPRLAFGAADNRELSLHGYLREFIPEENWPRRGPPTRSDIDRMAALFAEHSFWPTGDNRARQLFFFAYLVLLVLLVPDPGIVVAAIAPSLGISGSAGILVPLILLGFGLMILGAWAATRTSFFLFDRVLAFVDDRLIQKRRQVHSDATLDPYRFATTRKSTTGVFISYRRSISASDAARLHEYLAHHIESDRIFMDIFGIGDGSDFVARIAEAIRVSDVLLVLINKQWLTVADGDGNRRLFNPDDHVCKEIQLALEAGLNIIPVLFDGAKMPAESDLPASIKSLHRRNAREISYSRWEYDVGELLKGIQSTDRMTGEHR